jgi:hypothetical protein
MTRKGFVWTWLEHVALVWRQDLVEREIDVIYAWDEESGSSGERE